MQGHIYLISLGKVRIKIYPETVIYLCKNDEHAPKNDVVIFQPKTTLKLALRSVNSFDAKNNEKRVIFTTSKTILESTLGNVNLFDARPMKTKLYSLQLSRKNATDFFFFFEN